jgi:hypothetical protein
LMLEVEAKAETVDVEVDVLQDSSDSSSVASASR